uniref:Uncharacterized protein n=1 Tax=Rhizophora mucronata TaxID=61149 RepID=A0A2P2QU05_RHIMU
MCHQKVTKMEQVVQVLNWRKWTQVLLELQRVLNKYCKD